MFIRHNAEMFTSVLLASFANCSLGPNNNFHNLKSYLPDLNACA